MRNVSACRRAELQVFKEGRLAGDPEIYHHVLMKGNRIQATPWETPRTLYIKKIQENVSLAQSQPVIDGRTPRVKKTFFILMGTWAQQSPEQRSRGLQTVGSCSAGGHRRVKGGLKEGWCKGAAWGQRTYYRESTSPHTTQKVYKLSLRFYSCLIENTIICFQSRHRCGKPRGRTHESRHTCL